MYLTRTTIQWLLCCLAFAWSNLAAAQHFGHTYNYSGSVEIEHLPDHDVALPSLPDDLILRFSDYVTLLKLTVKTADEKTVDIKFRYHPEANRVFIWPLPDLPSSPYYTVDWGALDRERKMMAGQFRFSAGPDALKPSIVDPEEEEEHIMVPDYRLVEPGSFVPPPNDSAN